MKIYRIWQQKQASLFWHKEKDDPTITALAGAKKAATVPTATAPIGMIPISTPPVGSVLTGSDQPAAAPPGLMTWPVFRVIDKEQTDEVDWESVYQRIIAEIRRSS